jgi:hypothetical protein
MQKHIATKAQEEKNMYKPGILFRFTGPATGHIIRRPIALSLAVTLTEYWQQKNFPTGQDGPVETNRISMLEYSLVADCSLE